ncbi:MAG TPA: methylated-DNA--[protein]-cysteine S-methyltransferase [Rhizomicrobium sp.]|jgi:methylated-DNA-[protein]-cysteine S-methyltransferase
MAESETFFFDVIESPVGKLAIVADRKGAMRMLSFDGDGERWRREFARRFPHAKLERERDPFGHASTLKTYFAGDMEALDRIPVVFGGTPFQNKVWKALRRIPVGKTLSYGALAKKIGEPNAMRAVGLANGSNPIAVIVPCHRVIGSNGSLTGFGGGLPRKKWLIEHEARHCAKAFELEVSA